MVEFSRTADETPETIILLRPQLKNKKNSPHISGIFTFGQLVQRLHKLYTLAKYGMSLYDSGYIKRVYISNSFHVYTQTHTHAMFTHRHTDTDTHRHAQTDRHTHTDTHIHTQRHTHTGTLTHTHTHSLSHTHTHTHKVRKT